MKIRTHKIDQVHFAIVRTALSVCERQHKLTVYFSINERCKQTI